MEKINVVRKVVPLKKLEFDLKEHEPVETSSFIKMGESFIMFVADIKDCKILKDGTAISYDIFCDLYNKYIEEGGE